LNQFITDEKNTDEMLKEMIAVVGLANKNNRLVDSYHVEVDEIYK